MIGRIGRLLWHLAPAGCDLLAALGIRECARAVINEMRANLQALSDVRSWHRWQLGQKSDHHMHGRESHEEAISCS